MTVSHDVLTLTNCIDGLGMIALSALDFLKWLNYRTSKERS